ncbi:hypothetical protein NBRC116583_08550 [Arenicella sp. 4NH20-0111]|uniref:hypothetical protein n=1 Tax=Arenicella sp. 4NH20-0111 TaxID=3127648 RepID=UPI0031040304
MSDEKKLEELKAHLEDNPKVLKAFLDNPMTARIATKLGLTGDKEFVPPGPTMPSIPAQPDTSGEKAWIEEYWWGIEIHTNEKLTDNIVDGVTVGAPLSALIVAVLTASGLLTAGAGTVIGAAFGAAFAAKTAQIKMVHNNNGVYWPITWLQWGAVLAAAPGGPVSLSTAIMAFIHPVRR